MPLPLGERFLLRKGLVLRRISSVKSVPMEQLIKALEEDEQLVRERTPDLYFQDAWSDLHFDIQEPIEDGLIEWTNPSGHTRTLRRTRLGDQFMRTLEPHLSQAIDDMPMSGEDILDFLGSI